LGSGPALRVEALTRRVSDSSHRGPARVVSCAELTTRPRGPKASRVVRAADDATSRGANARTSLGGLDESRAARPSGARPDRTNSIPRSLEGHRVTPRVVRSAHDTKRTNARPELPGPVRAWLVSRAGARDASRHVPKRERRKPQRRPKAIDGRPNGTRPAKPCGRGDDALARSAPSAPPGFAGRVPFGAHARPRTRVQEAPNAPRAVTSKLSSRSRCGRRAGARRRPRRRHPSWPSAPAPAPRRRTLARLRRGRARRAPSRRGGR